MVDVDQLHPVCPYDMVKEEVDPTVDPHQGHKDSENGISKVDGLQGTLEVVHTLTQSEHCVCMCVCVCVCRCRQYTSSYNCSHFLAVLMDDSRLLNF